MKQENGRRASTVIDVSISERAAFRRKSCVRVDDMKTKKWPRSSIICVSNYTSPGAFKELKHRTAKSQSPDAVYA